MRLHRGQVVDRYRVEGLLGEGGMAVVYKVQHVELHTWHALKILSLEGKGLAERLITEGRIQARMRHRNIVSVTDAVRIDGRPALVMEFIDGPSLDILLHRYQPTLAQADELAQGILAGVAYAHAMGLVHRDLKPGNVLVVIENGEVVPKVTDFGIAKLLTDDVERLVAPTRTGVSMGTPTFMAPEQFKDAKTADGRADVFSLGALLYELVAGAPAFQGDNLIDVYHAMMVEKYRKVGAYRAEVPDRMERAIEGALKAKPDQRWATCERLLQVWRGEDHGAYTPLSEHTWEPHHVALVQQVPRTPPQPGLPALDTSDPEKGGPTLTPDAVVGALAAPIQDTRPPRWPLALAGLLAAGVIGTLVLGIVLAVAWGPSWSTPEVQVKSTTSADVPEPEPVVPEPEPVVPAPAPEPALVAAVTPSPVHVEPAPRRFVPVPAPAPAPVVPEAAPVAIERLPSDQATVTVSGVERAYLVDRAGARVPVGPVDPGTYSLLVFFDPADPTTVMRDIVLEKGQTLDLTCNPGLRMCR